MYHRVGSLSTCAYWDSSKKSDVLKNPSLQYFFFLNLKQMATGTSYRQEILIPRDQICEFDAMPLPSAVINEIVIHDENITITNFTTQDLGGRISEVVVNVEWRRPGSSVSVYDVRVTERQSLLDDESDFGEVFTLQRIEVCVRYSF